MKRVIWVLGMLVVTFGLVTTAPEPSLADEHRCKDHACSLGSHCPPELWCTACLPIEGICGPA